MSALSLVVCLAGAASALPISANRQCTLLGGEVAQVSAPSSPAADDDDHIALCQFDRASLTTQTLYDATILHRCPSAVGHFLKPSPFPQWGGGNPASEYCASLGGEPQAAKNANGDALALCTFRDGSQVEEWTLLRGPKAAPSLRDALDAAHCS